MKKFLSVILILCLVFASAVPVFAADASGASLELVKYKGKVTVTTSAGKNVELKSDKGTKLVSGYTVKTGAASYAYISLDQTQAVKMDASTTVTIDQNGKKLDINLVSGTLSYDVKAPLKKDQSTTVSTSNSITGIRGTFGLVRTFFDITLGRQISTTILFEGHSKVSTLGNNGSVVSTKDVFASNLLESIENVARLSQMTKEDFAGFIAIELAEDPALLSRVEKALAESGNPEAAAIDVREIAANAEEILAAEEKQAEEDAKALETELAAQKAEQDRLEAAAKTDKLDGQDDAVQLFDGETATDPAADAVSAEDAENTGDSSSSGSSGSSNPSYDNTFDPADSTGLDNAFAQAAQDAQNGKTSVINAPAGQYNNPINLGQGVTLNSKDGFEPTQPITLNGGKLTGTLNSQTAVINVTGQGSEISGNIKAGALTVENGGSLNVPASSNLESGSLSVTGGEMTNRGTVTTTDSLNVTGGTYDTTGGTNKTNGNVRVSGTGTLKANNTKITGDTHEITIGSSANVDNPTVTGGVTLENGAALSMNNGNLSGGVTLNGCTVFANKGTINGGIKSNAPASGAVDARVIISGATINGGITGHYIDDYSNPGVEVTAGTVNGGINLDEGNVEVSSGTLSGGTYGIKTPHGITVSGGTVSGTDYGIYFVVDSKTVTISGGDISGATGLYVKNDGSGTSSAYVEGGTITGTNGDGIRVENAATLKIGGDDMYGNNIIGNAVISSNGGSNTGGINCQNATTNVALISGTIKNSATSGYALKGDRFEIGSGQNEAAIVSGKLVKLYAPTKARVASKTDITSQVIPGEANTYAITSTNGTGANSVLIEKTVTTLADLQTELSNAQTAFAQNGDITTITIDSTAGTIAADPNNVLTVSEGTTLVSANNFQPNKVVLNGGTLQGSLSYANAIVATDTAALTSTLDCSFTGYEIDIPENATLVITTGSSITATNGIIIGTSGTLENHTTISDNITLQSQGTLENYGSIQLGDGRSFNLSNATVNSSGTLRLAGDSGLGATLSLTNNSVINGKVQLAGYSELNLDGGSVIQTSDDAALVITDNASATIGGTVKATSNNGIEFGGASLKITTGTISGQTALVADSSNSNIAHNLVITGGSLDGNSGNAVTLKNNITMTLGEVNGTGAIAGRAHLRGTTNGIEFDSNGSGSKCYLLSGQIESTSGNNVQGVPTRYVLAGAYNGAYNSGNTNQPDGFYIGNSNTETAQLTDYITNSQTVLVKTGASAVPNPQNPERYLGSWNPTGSDFEDAGNTWYYLKAF